MAVNISGPKVSHRYLNKSFGLSCEEAEDTDDWRMRIKGAHLAGNCCSNGVC